MAHPPAYQAVTFGTAGASLRRFEPFQVGLRQCPSERNGQMSGYTANPFPSLVPLPVQTGAKARGFSPTALESTAETDSPLEGAGFEPSVPLRWCDGSRPHPWYDVVRRRDKINIEEGGDPNAPTGETLALAYDSVTATEKALSPGAPKLWAECH